VQVWRWARNRPARLHTNIHSYINSYHQLLLPARKHHPPFNSYSHRPRPERLVRLLPRSAKYVMRSNPAGESHISRCAPTTGPGEDSDIQGKTRNALRAQHHFPNDGFFSRP